MISLYETHIVSHIWPFVTNLGVDMARFTQFPLMIPQWLLSMKSLVRALPAAAYMSNTVPICDPGGLNSHGLV